MTILRHETIGKVFSSLGIHPVLMHVGARRHSPPIWAPVAPYSVYVGVGPEARTVNASSGKGFWQVHLIECALTDTEGQNTVPANVCLDPIYSGVLKPLPSNAIEYLNLDGGVISQSEWPACTLDSVLERLELRRLDWLYLNINGVEARVYLSIKDEMRKRILALDTSMDFIDIYQGQDRSLEAYRTYIDDGFWLSRVSQYGPVKIGRRSVQELTQRDPSLTEQYFKDHHRRIPGWFLGRFLRTINSLRAGEFSPQQYIVLWSFALADSQFGFAADIAFEYKRLFGPDEVFRAMLEETIHRLKALRRPLSVVGVARRLLPQKIKARLRQFLG